MLVDVQSVLTQIQTAKTQWGNIAPSVSQTNLFADDITKEFDYVVAILDALGEEADLNGVAWQIVTTQLNLLLPNAGNAGQVNNLVMQLWAMKNALIDSIPQDLAAKEKSFKLNKNTKTRIALIHNYLEQAELSRDKLEEINEKANELNEGIDSLSTVATSTQATISEQEKTIAGFEKTAQHATESAVQKLEEMSEFLEGIEQATEQQNELLEEFENRKTEIADLLENANKVGLAKSFQEKKKELTTTWRVWAILFSLGILGLGYIGYKEILPLLEKDTIDPVSIALRFMVSAPIIWFTWFAARQYGHVMRISEDYAFKEASAMSFIGYRNEMATDPEMLKLLQQNAIKNFGENPAKLLLKKADASSPLHHAFDTVIEKMKPDELIRRIFSGGG